MYKKIKNIQKEYQPSNLQECFLDFILSRQAMLCTPRTISFYKYNVGKFLEWLETKGISEPEEITAKHVREYLANYAERGCSDSYVHTHARSTRTFLHFLYSEEYIPQSIKFQMPKIGEMRLPVLSVEEIKKVLKACSNIRDKSIILLMVDTGIRQAEICALDWGDIDLQTGICIIRKGKGKKTRSVVLGVTTRRTILSYRRIVRNDEKNPVFQTSAGKRLSPLGLRSMFVRLTKLSGIQFSAHALRRSFVVMSLQGGMSLAHVQAFMGHTTPKMTLHYARLVDDDLLTAHNQHGPVDSLLSK